jgi:hypothetical protein
MLTPTGQDSSDKRLQFGTHDAIWLMVQGANGLQGRLHVLTPPGVERRLRRHPAGPTRVNVYLFIHLSEYPREGTRWLRRRPAIPFTPCSLPTYVVIPA